MRGAACFDPRFGVERRAPRTRSGRTGFVCTDGGVALSFTADRDFVPAPGRVAEFELAPNQPLTIAFTAAHRSPLTAVAPELAWRALLEDEARWQGWSRAIDFGLL